MARRRRSKRRSPSGSLWALELTALLLVLGSFGYLLTTTPMIALLVALIVALAAGGSASLLVWWRARRRERSLARARTLHDLLLLTPTQFEYAVGELLRVWGYRDVRHTGGGGDLAADLTCRTPDGRFRVVVQCKRYAPGARVGSPDVQMFIGMLTIHHHAQMGIFVTTSSYTRPALALAEQHQLRMIDGAQLVTSIQRLRSHG